MSALSRRRLRGRVGRASRRGDLALGALALALIATASSSAHAQVVARSNDRSEGGLLRRFGVGAAASGLAEDDPEGRRRAVERLAAIGTKEAHAALVDALEPGILREGARLIAIRALASRVDDEDVRGALAREVLQAGGARRDGGRGASEPSRLAAALVLARSGHARALAALGGALREGGAAGAAAREALLAYPPVALEPLAGKVGTARSRVPVDGSRLPPEILAFFGELGDARALPWLRAALGASTPEARAAAARSLATLGDAAALTFAVQTTGAEPALRVARAEVLLRFADPRAIPAVVDLLGDERTRRDGLRLARSAPDPRYAKALTALLASSPALAGDVVPAIAECATAEGAAALALRLGDRGTAPSAAVALARAPGKAARDALATLLARPAAELGRDRGEAVVLAGIVRALALGDTLPGLEGHLVTMAREAPPSGAELAAFGLVALEMRDVAEVLEAKPSSVTEEAWWGAVARGALARGASARAQLADLYLAREGGRARAAAAKASDREPAGTIDSAAAVGLLDAPTAARWSTSSLLDAVRSGGVAAPLAARELARRDDGSLRADVDALLAGSDPAVRAHVALGLGHGEDLSAPSRLALAATDDDPAVRAAAVRALSRRGGPAARRVFDALGAFDADAGVRSLARLAGLGRKLPDPVAGGGDVGVMVVVADDAAAPGRRAWTARVTRPDGLLVPVVVPTGGWLVVPGIGSGASSVALIEPAATEVVPLRAAAPAPAPSPALDASMPVPPTSGAPPLAPPPPPKKPGSP